MFIILDIACFHRMPRTSPTMWFVLQSQHWRNASTSFRHLCLFAVCRTLLSVFSMPAGFMLQARGSRVSRPGTRAASSAPYRQGREVLCWFYTARAHLVGVSSVSVCRQLQPVLKSCFAAGSKQFVWQPCCMMRTTAAGLEVVGCLSCRTLHTYFQAFRLSCRERSCKSGLRLVFIQLQRSTIAC